MHSPRFTPQCPIYSCILLAEYILAEMLLIWMHTKLMHHYNYSVPQSWATVQISTPPDDRAVVGREFVMTCTVTAVRGLTVVPIVTWTGPDGNLTDAENITVGPAQTIGLMTSWSLTLHYLQSPEGGQYSCEAAISLPGFETLPQRSAHKQLVVISMLKLST